MAGTYTQQTLGDAWADLGNRLFDPTHVRWVTEELTIYVQQALRTYNALTNHFRAEGSFQSASPEAFYDLPTVMPSFRAQSYSLIDAVNQVCYHLLEPVPVMGAWAGTEQYSLGDILTAIQQSRDQFLLETGIVQTRSQLTVDPVPSNNQLNLEQEIINLRRLSWKTANGIITLLRRDDQWSLTNFAVGWKRPSAAPPEVFSVSTQPPLIVQLAPYTNVPGTLDMLTINSGPVPDILDPTQTLGVPNDWAWVVIFGALVQLFSRDGLAIDVPRAQYCQQRWNAGLQMAKMGVVVLAAEINGDPSEVGSIADADLYSPSWPMVPSTPNTVLTAGQNVVALYPPPGVPSGGGNFTITLQLVRNAPVPTVASDFLQVGDDVVNGILDYAQHLALIKEGGAQIQSTDALLKSFFDLCGTVLDIQYASQPHEMAAAGQTPQDARVITYQEPRG